MRKYYKKQRNLIISQLKQWDYADKLTIYEQDAGLHFILKVETDLSDRQLGKLFEAEGLGIRCLTDYYHEKNHGDLHCLVVNYAPFGEDTLPRALKALERLFQTEKNG